MCATCLKLGRACAYHQRVIDERKSKTTGAQ